MMIVGCMIIKESFEVLSDMDESNVCARMHAYLSMRAHASLQ